MENYLKDDFSSKLKAFRKEKGLTLDSLAKKINQKYNTLFNKSMLSKWENRYSADLNSLKILSLYFNVSLNEMLGFNESTNLKEIIGYTPKPLLVSIKNHELKDYFFLKVESNNSDAEFQEGDFILIKKDCGYSDWEIGFVK
ncbi:helix-turn-helix domain-containing protein [Siminovitchia terrae]|uniref:helix-turn-helix domain-containing protein n=1 Tax=Siminovitchia terrae TaxID=1914933 RepID=UPI0028AC9836|nr:helix-turn-helix transcriptional regulator [Siminovitchia terrae]